ncbi:MAG TPA: VOC family protein [Rugosimonospora sp.]|nr:VOC family protein [Rugosimonospora sp.]
MRVRGYAEATPCWAALASADPAGAVAFYSALFGWQYADGVFRLGDSACAGLVLATTPGPEAGWLTYVSTEDIAGTTAAVATAGGTVVCPPAPAPPGGLAALYADSSGAVFAGWQRQTFAGAQVVNEPGTMLWNEVAVRDASLAEGFYATVFGWSTRPAAAVPGLARMEWEVAGREVAGLITMNGGYPPDVRPHWRTVFEVDNVAETVRRCEALGGLVVSGPRDADMGSYGYLQDPQGTTFGVVDLVPELRDRL